MLKQVVLTLASTALMTAVPAGAEIVVSDDTGREIRMAEPARRIVSLAPHITELLFAAGAGERVVGVVAYSNHPEAAAKITQVGAYNSVDLEAIAALSPDLIVAWQTGNTEAHLDRLEALGIPVFMNEPRSLDDVADSIEALGHIAGTDAFAASAAGAFRARRAELAARFGARPKVRMFYQIWDQPLMTVNDKHLISDVIRLCGGENVFGTLSALAPHVGVESVLAANPEVIVASGMGELRPEWLDQWRRWPELAASRHDNLFFVHPDLIQRHTPRILDGAEQLCGFLEQARERRGPFGNPTVTIDGG